MEPSEYDKLRVAVSKINFPTSEELSEYMEEGLSIEDAILEEMKDRYSNAAKLAGFTRDQGLAMLQYAILLQEVGE